MKFSESGIQEQLTRSSVDPISLQLEDTKNIPQQFIDS